MIKIPDLTTSKITFKSEHFWTLMIISVLSLCGAVFFLVVSKSLIFFLVLISPLLFYLLLYRKKKVEIDFANESVKLYYLPVFPFLKGKIIDRSFYDLNHLLVHTYEDNRLKAVGTKDTSTALNFLFFSLITKNEEEIVLLKLNEGFSPVQIESLVKKFEQLAARLKIEFKDEKKLSTKPAMGKLSMMSETVEDRDTISDDMQKLQASNLRNKKYKLL